jgi:hypothetical protein
LLPNRVQNISAEHVEDIHTRYEDDLPDSIGFIAEMERWKMLKILHNKRSSNENSPSLNKDHPLKTHPPSTKIIH